MAFPLLLAAMLGGMAVSGGANLYGQYQQRKLYRSQAKAYKNLDRGYRDYLASQGREINPDRAWTSYYGQYKKAQKGIDVSYAQSVGTLGGTIGAGAGLSSKSLYNPSKMKSVYKWL